MGSRYVVCKYVRKQDNFERRNLIVSDNAPRSHARTNSSSILPPPGGCFPSVCWLVGPWRRLYAEQWLRITRDKFQWVNIAPRIFRPLNTSKCCSLEQSLDSLQFAPEETKRKVGADGVVCQYSTGYLKSYK